MWKLTDSAWFQRFFSRQARKPSGLFGKFVATRLFDKGNAPLNTLMMNLADVREGENILEVGFGSGSVVRDMADRVGNGMVEGIDFSDAMMGVACKRNSHHIEAGRVRLQHGDFDMVDYPHESFDTVCSANTIYFWSDPANTCARMFSALKPGGKVILAFVDKEKMDGMPLDMDVFKSISCEEVEALLRDAAFAEVEVHRPPQSEAMYCVVGRK